MPKILLSVVILTKNDEPNIAECIKSVRGWADEIIVIDDFSIDNTVKIAQELADRVLIKKMEVEGTHRNWSYAQAKNKWVLSLEANERMTPELKEEMTRAIEDTDCVCFSIPARNYIGGYWVRYGGWYPARKIKLFHKNRFIYEDDSVSPKVSINGNCGHLKCDIIHKRYPDFESFLADLNYRTTLEAQKWIIANRRIALWRVIWRAKIVFLKTFIWKKAWKDGFIGFMVAFFDAFYQIVSYAKYRQIFLAKSKPR